MFDWIAGFVESGGYAGIVLLMLLENVFPPIPSELIMPLAGFAASRGEMNLALVIASGSLGSVLGAVFWYYLGRWLGTAGLRKFAARHGRWLTLSPGDVDRADRWFDRHGIWVVVFGRLLPAVRTLISVPAGVSEMRLLPFLVATTIGTVLWTSLLTALGYVLAAEYAAVADWVDPVSKVVIGLLVAGYLYRVVTFSGRDRGAGDMPPPSG